MVSYLRIWGMTCILTLALPLPLAAQYAFSFTAGDQGHVSDLGCLTTFPTLVANTGLQADTYTLVVTKSMPAGWSASFCQGTVCYASFVEEITFSLTAGQETNVDLDVTPADTPGSGVVCLTITSQGDPGHCLSKNFHVLTPGLDALLVDADGGDPFETYYQAMLEEAGLSFGTWPRQEAGALSNLELAQFDKVIWFCGQHAPGLDDADRSALAYFLQHGGALFLSGQNLAYEACDPLSPFYSAMAAAWLPVILGCNYVQNGTAYDLATGPAGDPVTGGMTCHLQGGDGAQDNQSCDVIASAGGVANLLYDGGGIASVRSTYGAGHSFFCAFGVEGLTSAAERSALLDAFLDWTDAPTPAFGPADRILVRQLQATPNPFNPRTVLHFETGGTRASPVTVDILDVRGRVVRRLFQGEMSPGPQALVWSGRNDSGQPASSGLYLARITLGHQTTSTKLVLAK